MWPDATVTVGEAFTNGARLIAANKAATVTASAIWFISAMMTAASNFAMPVIAQYLLLLGGLFGSFIGTGILGRYTILSAAQSQPTTRHAITFEQTAARFTVTSFVIALAGVIVMVIGVALTGGNPAAVKFVGIPAVLIAVLAVLAPYNSALGAPLGTAITNSFRAITAPRIAVTAFVAVCMIGLSMTIPILGLLLMPWQSAALAYLRFHDPSAKQAASIAD
ncbi:hypothetical protein [Gordonia sihwensis]|uniref:hypothetical protein n=1 Tax=Gordonia sihwensis TaxID=173559 RepID=UPI003D98748A